jgi:AmpD protein
LTVGAHLNPETGWCSGARLHESPNHDARPYGTAIDLIVIHAISLPAGEFGGGYIDALFLNRLQADAHPSFAEIAKLKVSAHFLIERSGRLTQFVSTLARAWHCGVSHYRGRTACNDFSIGIELEGCDELRFTPAQYGSLNLLLIELMRHYRTLDPVTIVGHSEIAPGRKTDPGPHFDWERMRALLRAYISSPHTARHS